MISTSSKSAIFSRQAKSGCEVLVHHLLTVDGVTPSSPASQRAVRFFSNSTIFIRLISSIFNSLLHKGSDLFSISSQNNEIIENVSHFLCFFMQNRAFSPSNLWSLPHKRLFPPLMNISRKSHGHTFKKTPFPNITSTNLLPSIYEG